MGVYTSLYCGEWDFGQLWGGELPDDWSAGAQLYLWRVEDQLKRTRKKPDLERPLTFRTFFPALRDLLPVYSFAKKDNRFYSSSLLTEKNPFLVGLSDNKNNLINRKVEVITISGVGTSTLEKIYLSKDRTEDDIKNERWRDGHPPESPYLQQTVGDKTVLFQSASLSEVSQGVWKAENIEHVDLPNYARETVSLIVTIPHYDEIKPAWLPNMFSTFKNSFANLFSFVTVHAQSEEYFENIPEPLTFSPFVDPSSTLSFTVSSNVSFELVDPEGKILSRDKNDFGEDNANFDDDPDDSEDIILVTIRNPKVGKYMLKITGNIAGDYYVDSTYVNDNGVFDDTNEGKVTEGEEVTLEAVVSEISGVDLPENETEEEPVDTTTSDNDNKPEDKKSNLTGPNTAKDRDLGKRSGTVLGTATVRLKLSEVILGVRQRLTTEIASARLGGPRKDGLGEREIASPTHHKGAGLQPSPRLRPAGVKTGGLTKKDFILLVGPVNDMLARARAYESAKTAKNTKLAESLLVKIKLDYLDFDNKMDRLIASGRLNKQTVNILNTLTQRLRNAGLR